MLKAASFGMWTVPLLAFTSCTTVTSPSERALKQLRADLESGGISSIRVRTAAALGHDVARRAGLEELRLPTKLTESGDDEEEWYQARMLRATAPLAERELVRFALDCASNRGQFAKVNPKVGRLVELGRTAMQKRLVGPLPKKLIDDLAAQAYLEMGALDDVLLEKGERGESIHADARLKQARLAAALAALARGLTTPLERSRIAVALSRLSRAAESTEVERQWQENRLAEFLLRVQ